jgi:hypothetical protein
VTAQAHEQGWVGWYRPGGGAWKRLCRAPTFGGAWAELLRRLPATGGGGESVCLPASRHPDQNASKGRRRR